jgi:thioesterase domain-containing protein
MNLLKKSLQEYLLEHIPISSAMGITVDSASTQKIILSAPISNNINHKKTVFGGSLHAVATLACWSLLHLNLKNIIDDNIQIVIANSEVAYTHPVTADFKAECAMPDRSDWDRFIKSLKKRKKARINLNAKIYENGKLCVDYSGVFVALVPAIAT